MTENESKAQELIRLMLKLLMTYEAEMTAYHIVLDTIDKGMLAEGRDLHVQQGLEKLSNSMGLPVEVEAVYAGFHAIQGRLDTASLDAALANIRRILTDRNSRFMPS